MSRFVSRSFRPTSRQARRTALLLGSATAAFLLSPAAAQAACAPDPALANGTIDCTGVDLDGLTVNAANVRLNVRQGAAVNTSSDPAQASAVTITAIQGSRTFVDGTITGEIAGENNDKAGYSTVGANRIHDLFVARSGVIRGRNAIDAMGDLSVVRLTNAGRIEATEDGAAIRTGANGAFMEIVNRAGGTIDGDVTGLVAFLENSGRITGDITASTLSRGIYQRIGGVIDGDVMLGARGTTQFLLEWRGGTSASGVDLARVSAGAATDDRFGYRVTTAGADSLTLGDLATGFERFALDLCGCDTVVTVAGLADNAAYTAPLDITGEGRVILQGRYDIDGATRAMVVRGTFEPDDGDGDTRLDVVNDGSIDIGGAVSLGLQVDGTDRPTTFTNNGSIAVGYTGQVIGVDVARGATFTNATGATLTVAGGPTAEGIALNADNAQLENAGTIAMSGNGRNIELGASTFTNSGTVTASGADFVVGARAGSRILNTGTIRSTTGGQKLAVRLSNGTLVNEGLVEGDVQASVVGTLSNRGRIDGNISGQNGNLFVQLGEGSTVTGNVAFNIGGQHVLAIDTSRVSSAGVLDLGARGTDPALVGGTLATNSTSPALWLQATSTRTVDALAPNVSVTNFGMRVYEAAGENTVLTLNGPRDGQGNIGNIVDGRLNLAGDGTVVLDGSTDIILNNAQGAGDNAIRVTGDSTAARVGSTARKLRLIQRGDIVANNAGNGSGFVAVDLLAADGSTTNAEAYTLEGKIAINAGTAIEGGAAAVTLASGTGAGISIGDTAIGITSLGGTVTLGADITEVGNIRAGGQAIGALFAGGGSLSLQSAADIRVDGTAVQGTGGGVLSVATGGIGNDIVSHLGTAIDASQSGGLRLTNAGGAVIQSEAANLAAVLGSTGTDVVVNGGDIRGNVDLGDGPDVYVTERPAAGGYTNQVTGSVFFGTGADTALTRVGTHNVTGVLSGGGGIERDAIGVSFVTSGTRALDDGALDDTAVQQDFEMHAVEALNDRAVTTVTLTGSTAAGVRLFGDGTIINEATVNVEAANAFETGVGLSTNLAFINRSAVTTGAFGVDASTGIRAFENSGTIASVESAARLVALASTDAFRFTNSGSLVSSRTDEAVSLDVREIDGTTSADILNSGVIRNATAIDGTNGLVVSAFGAVRLANSGSGALIEGRTRGVQLSALSAEILNSGLIQASGVQGSALRLAVGDGTLLADADCPPEVAALLGLRVDNSGTLRTVGDAPVNGTQIDGSITLYAQLDDEASAAEVINRAGATIEATGANAAAILIKGVDSNVTDGAVAGRTTIRNDGVIRGTGAASSDASLFSIVAGGAATFEEGQYRIGAVHTSRTNDLLINAASGSISGDVVLGDGNDRVENFGLIDGDVYLGAGDDAYLLTLTGTLAAGRRVFGGSGFDALSVDGEADIAIDGSRFVGFEALAFTGNKTLSGAYDVETIGVDGGTITVPAGATLSTNGATTITGGDRADTVVNFGTIAGGVSLGAGDDRYVDVAGSSVGGPIDGGAGRDTYAFQVNGARTGVIGALTGFEGLEVTGTGVLTTALAQSFETITIGTGSGLTLSAAAVLDDGVNQVDLRGTLTGNLSLAGGADTIVFGPLGRLDGAVDGGAGDDLILIDTAAGSERALTGTFTSFERLRSTGTGTLRLTDAQAFAVDLVGGSLTVASGATLTGSVTGDAAANTLTVADRITGAVDLGAGDDRYVDVAGSSVGGPIDGGAGRDTYAFQVNGARTGVIGALTGFENLEVAGAGTLTTALDRSFETITIGTGSTLALTADAALDDGANRLDVLGTLAGSLTLAGGADVLSFGPAGRLDGAVDGGAGDDLILIDTAAGSERALTGTFTNFERLRSTGAGTLQLTGERAFAVELAGGSLDVASGATLTGSVTGDAAANTLTVAGRITGAVDLGAGDDRLMLTGGDLITGPVVGGAGTDTLAFATAGTEAAPSRWEGSHFTGFEALENNAGTLALAGPAAFSTVSVNAGRLIGEAGSALTANTVVVRPGATFGSAGTVNASIAVGGTLSPGASPGVMTVNGDVALASGSNLLLELDPQAQDRLDISGTLTIAQGATLDITGTLTSLPGAALDLVVAGGGITGDFTTINRSSSVFGFLTRTANRLQLRGEFQNEAGFAANVRSSIDYVNEVLASGQAVQTFTAALPRLTDASGRSNARAFGQLSPEAYASAMQIGTQNALALTDAVRGATTAMPERQGFQAFAQGVATWGDLDAEHRVTTADGGVDTTGILSGLAYGFEDGSRAGAFISRVDAEQRLSALDAASRGDQFAVGVFGEGRYGALGFHGLVAYATGDATTTRTLDANQATARGSYDLDSWVADAGVHYRVEVNGVTVIAPKLGFTYARTKRTEVSETSGGALALAVGRATKDQLFGDIGLALRTMAGVGGMTVEPWGEFGLRHRLDGGRTAAAARFVGVTGDSFTARGVENADTVARAGAGLGVAITPLIRLNASYAYELGDSSRHSLTGGLSLSF